MRKYGKVVVMRRCSSKTLQEQGAVQPELSITTGCRGSEDPRRLAETESWQIVAGGSLPGLLFHRQAGFDVEVGGFRTFMAEVKCNHFSGNVCFQQSHRGSVPKGMRRDVTLLEGGNFCGSAIDKPLKLIGRTRAA